MILQLRGIAFFLLSLSLSGCFSKPEKNIIEICAEYPQMCKGFNTDAWCRKEKSNIIRTRYAQLQAPSDSKRHALLLQFEDYRDCVNKAAQIEHLEYKDKKNSRVEGLLMAKRELKQLAANTKHADDPALAYYHWSRFQDNQALERFLRYEQEGRLNSAPLLINLAEYYTKVNTTKTIDILLNALALYPPDSDIDPAIFDSLSTIYLAKDKLKHAYVWAYLAKQYRSDKKKKQVQVELSDIKQALQKVGTDVDALEDLAEQYMTEISDGEFTPKN